MSRLDKFRRQISEMKDSLQVDLRDLVIADLPERERSAATEELSDLIFDLIAFQSDLKKRAG